jgi:hypothetical protein
LSETIINLLYQQLFHNIQSAIQLQAENIDLRTRVALLEENHSNADNPEPDSHQEGTA